MDYRTISQSLAVCIAANVPVLIWGPPGAGKTSVMTAIARAYDLHLEVVIASIRDPSDFSGIPFIHEGAAHFIPPRWAKEVVNQHEEFERSSIIMYDEISTATPALQAALLRPILEGVAGDLELPESARSVATANPPSIAADGWEPSPPLCNRFTHLDWELEAAVVKKGFTEGFSVPEVPVLPKEAARERRYAIAKSMVGIFLGTRPHLVSHVPQDFGASEVAFSASDYAFPTPRSWEMASRLYAVCTMGMVNGGREPIHPAVLSTLLKGTVGVAAATEFLAFVEQMDLPDPLQYLMRKVEIPESLKRGDQVEAFLSSLEYAFKSRPIPEVWDRFGDALAHFADIGKSDAAYRHTLMWYSMRPEGAVPSGRHVDSLKGIIHELDNG